MSHGASVTCDLCRSNRALASFRLFERTCNALKGGSALPMLFLGFHGGCLRFYGRMMMLTSSLVSRLRSSSRHGLGLSVSNPSSTRTTLTTSRWSRQSIGMSHAEHEPASWCDRTSFWRASLASGAWVAVPELSKQQWLARTLAHLRTGFATRRVQVIHIDACEGGCLCELHQLGDCGRRGNEAAL
eukprot:1252499-Amphidinium_carterae.1